MKLPRLAKLAAVTLAAAFAIAATGNWNTVVTVTPEGAHAIGNPDAKLKLDEYVSYTCPHCAHFARDGEGALDLAYIGSGKVQVTIHSFIRDPIDLTAAMLAACGPRDKFMRNHMMFMLEQDKWLPKAINATKAQQNRWFSGDYAARRRAIASDMGFYDMMDSRGYTPAQVDRCLSDDVLAKKLTDQTQAAEDKLGIPGTPGFVLDGLLLTGTFTWETLQPQLDARL
ncbi:DsbA family protein [Tsuneonella mangrovi]|uniref:DsbA family protein n=1 Tax=Tsuneonella mangrovi TaxID=1982042 RepID=UPI000BA28E2C|nr:thioredoxin domain-containing protein [Tsuneonella mangrovi]